jgi:hypothetical protein
MEWNEFIFDMHKTVGITVGNYCNYHYVQDSEMILKYFSSWETYDWYIAHIDNQNKHKSEKVSWAVVTSYGCLVPQPELG